jgi:hypothetical protein
VEESDGPFGSRKEQDGFEGVGRELLLEFVSVVDLLRRYSVELVESTVIGLGCFYLEVVEPVLNRLRRSHVVCRQCYRPLNVLNLL